MRTGTIILLGVILIFFAFKCGKNWWGSSLVGRGDIVTQNFQVDPYNELEVSGAFEKVEFVQSDVSEVNVEGYQNLIEEMEVHTIDGRLKVRFKKGVFRIRGKSPKITIYGPLVEEIYLSGATTFKSENISNDSHLKLKSSGASDFKVKINSPNVEVVLSGAGKAKLEGLTRDLNVNISGAADIDAYELLSENTTVKISGAGKAEVFASKLLDVNATGAGSIYYKGNPQVNSKTSGAATLKQKN